MTYDNSFLDRHYVELTGRRYIFFNSLQSEKLAIYHKYYQYGLNIKNTIAPQLNPDISKSTEDDLNKIKTYIDYIKTLAETEAKNEINFIKQFTDILNNLDNCEFKDKMLEFISSLENGEISDYIKFLAIINTIMANKNTFLQKRQKVSTESMRFIQQSYNSAEDSLQTQISQALQEGDYKTYQNLIRSTYPQEKQTNWPRFSGAISSKYGAKFTSILRQVADDSSLINELKEAWVSQRGIDEQKAAMYIAATISTYLDNFSFEDLDKLTVTDIMKNIKTTDRSTLTSLVTDISENYANNIWNLLLKKRVVEKTIEEVALTTRRGLGELFLKMNSSSQEDVYKLYANYGFNKETLDNILENKDFDEKKKAALITEKLGKAIRSYAKKIWGLEIKSKYSKEQRIEIEKWLNEHQNVFQEFKKKHPRILDPNYIKNQLQVKMTGSASAEEMAMNAVQSLSKNDINVLLGGGVIKAKSDLQFTFTGALDFTEIDDIAAKNIKEVASKFHENFMNNIHDTIGDKVDTLMKKAIYMEELRDLKMNIIEELQKFYSGNELDQKIDYVLNQLNNLITGGVQVKDYVHGGTLGFMGESLGSNADKILQNVINMYDTGGISRLDYSLLFFVLANCGPDSIASDLQDDLAHYLLGGAMMILFDEGFTASKKFLQDTTEKIGFSPSAVHLFNLQGGHFVPASLVYTTVYNNLLMAYRDISSQIITLSKLDNITNNITIINNITKKNIPSYTTMSLAQDRWDTVKKLANDKENIDIKITFLAGILDIFEAIPNAFKY